MIPATPRNLPDHVNARVVFPLPVPFYNRKRMDRTLILRSVAHEWTHIAQWFVPSLVLVVIWSSLWWLAILPATLVRVLYKTPRGCLELEAMAKAVEVRMGNSLDDEARSLVGYDGLRGKYPERVCRARIAWYARM